MWLEFFFKIVKSIINRLFIGVALICGGRGFGSCVGDLDQLPDDPSTIMEPSFKENPREAHGSSPCEVLSGACRFRTDRA